VSKETYYSVIQAGDMANVLQMRPITVSKETYYNVKRDLPGTIQAGDMANVTYYVSKETYYVSRETYHCQKRPITVSKETYYSVILAGDMANV
jgi:hypothetical protein